MSLTKLFLAGKNFIIPGQGEFGDIPAGDGKITNLFLQCSLFTDNTFGHFYMQYMYVVQVLCLLASILCYSKGKESPLKTLKYPCPRKKLTSGTDIFYW